MLRYHEALGVAVDTLPIAIPISLRSSADAAGGNRWGAGRLGLPVGEKDPIARMRDVHREGFDEIAAVGSEPAGRRRQQRGHAGAA